MSTRFKLSRYWWFPLVVGVAAYLYLSTRHGGTLGGHDSRFAVAHSAPITSITLSSPRHTAHLERADDGVWMLNGTLPARGDAVQALLLVAQRLQAASPLPLSVADSLKALIQAHGTRVTLRAGRRTIREYRVHTTATMGLRAIGLVEGGRTAYQLQLPSFRGDVSALFPVNPTHWRTNSLGLGAPETFQRVEVEHPGNPEGGFAIALAPDGHHRLYEPMAGRTATAFDTTQLLEYLAGFAELTFETIEAHLTPGEREAALRAQPLQIITLHYTSGQELQLRVLPIPVERHYDPLGRPVHFDPHRVHLTLSGDTNLYRAQRLHMHRALRDISHFNPKF